MKILIKCMACVFGCIAFTACVYTTQDLSYTEPSKHEKPIKIAFVNVLRKMNEPVGLNHTSTGVEVFRFLKIPSFRGIAQMVQITILPENVAQIVSKSLKITPVGGERIVEQCMRTIQADEYEYILQLVDITDLWNLPEKQDDFIADGSMTMLEVQMKGKYHRIYDVYDRDYPVGMLCDYLLELANQSVDIEAQLWPMLAFYDVYEEICLDVTGICLARRLSDFESLSSKTDIREAFGDPHEVRTEPEGISWGYYLKDRSIMVLRFDHDGILQSSVPSILYSEHDYPEVKSEWLKPAKH